MNTNSKLRVALFFGGVSSEHDVSCVSASAWLRALGQEPCADKYEVFPVGITKDGRWLACRPTPETMADGSWEQGDCTPCVLSPDRKDHGIWLLQDGRAELVHIDICAPVMHGKNGEDGTIQGLFELARIPYVGCGVLGSAVCMDKAVANALMDAAGVPHCKWVAASRADLELNGPVVLDGIEAKLGYPIFVKPANAGSSVGISKAADRAALEKGLQASGLPLSAYLRKLILGESIQAAPSEELRRLRTEIHQIGNNINQLARKANAGFASRDEVTRALRMLDRVYELMYQLSQQSWQ